MYLLWVIAVMMVNVVASTNIGTTRIFPIKKLDNASTSSSKKFRRSISSLDPSTLLSVEDIISSSSDNFINSFLGAHALNSDVAATISGSTQLIDKGYWKKNSRGAVFKHGSLDSRSIIIDNNNTSDSISYYAEIKLGTFNESTEEKVFNVIVDTGSFLLGSTPPTVHWLNVLTIRFFDAEQSKTGTFTGLPFEVIYNTGLINGTFIQDRVRLAGFDFGNQYLGLANSGQSSFYSYAVDGILGFPSKDPDSSTHGILNTLYLESLISQRVIGISLSGDNGNFTDSNEGSLSIGGLDSEKYSGEIEYYSINNSSIFWEIPLARTLVNGTEVSFAAGNSDNGTRTVIVDTGTTLLLMPPNDALMLHSYIGNSSTDGSNFVIPCNSTIEFAFSFGTNSSSRNWTVGPDSYIGEQYNDEGFCLSNIQGLYVDEKQWVLGDVFLRGVYSVFDMDNAVVGFATKKSSNTSVTPESTFVSLSLNSSISTTSESSATATATATSTSGASGLYVGVYTLTLSLILQFLL